MTAVRSYRSAADTGRRAGWTAGRIVSALVGALLAVCSLGLLGAGGVAVWASATQRHGGGIDLGTWSYRSTGYAVTISPSSSAWASRIISTCPLPGIPRSRSSPASCARVSCPRLANASMTAVTAWSMERSSRP
jgi:hypothetical protein